MRTSSCGNPVYGMNWTSTLGYGDGAPDAEKHLRQGAIRHRNGLVIELPESMQFAITLDEKKVKVDKRPDNVKKYMST